MTKHALYATCETRDDSGQPATITFRVGQPTTLDGAHARYERLWAAGAIHAAGRAAVYCGPKRVRHARRWYRVKFMEVRATDRHGVGLGSERHGRAIPVPYYAARKAAA